MYLYVTRMGTQRNGESLIMTHNLKRIEIQPSGEHLENASLYLNRMKTQPNGESLLNTHNLKKKFFT
jgi:hypothetical protein